MREAQPARTLPRSVRDPNLAPWELRPNIFVPPSVENGFFYGKPSKDERGQYVNERSRMTVISARSVVARRRG